MASKLAQLMEQVTNSQAANTGKMRDLSLLDDSLLSSVAGGVAGPKLPSSYEEEGEEGANPYVKYWQDL